MLRCAPFCNLEGLAFAEFLRGVDAMLKGGLVAQVLVVPAKYAVAVLTFSHSRFLLADGVRYPVSLVNHDRGREVLHASPGCSGNASLMLEQSNLHGVPTAMRHLYAVMSEPRTDGTPTR